LKDLDFTSNLGLFNRLENLNDDSFVINCVDTFVDFGILSSSNLLDDLIIILGTIINMLDYY
jgi:hypothetical protein